MYDHITFFFWVLSIFLFIHGVWIIDSYPALLSFISESKSFFIIFSILFNLLLPVILDPIYLLFSIICTKSSFSKDAHKHYHLENKSPILYHKRYNISACFLEKCHPFDSKKYGRVYNLLRSPSSPHCLPLSPLVKITICPRYQLKIHPLFHLGLNYSMIISKCVEMPLCFLPAWFLRYRVLNPMLRATHASLIGVCAAIRHGYAINLSGGYHHASLKIGAGFCVYPDITLAVNFLREYHPQYKTVLIVDLDAHQGNGYESDFKRIEQNARKRRMSEEAKEFKAKSNELRIDGDEENNNKIESEFEVVIMDMYNHDIYPGALNARKRINVDISAHWEDETDGYLHKVKEGLKKIYEHYTIDFVIYNAGTDTMIGDPLGGLRVSEDGICLRDQIVFQEALERNIPILMLLSGGYQYSNAPVIARSIYELVKKFNLKV